MSLRVRSLSAVALLSLAAAAAPVLAGDAAPKGSPGPGYIKTDNVEHVLTLPLDTDSIGARVFEKNFYLRTAKGVTIYDTSNPELPTPKGFVAVPATPNQERENIDTNGEILVTGQAYDGILYVIDVTNKTTPTIVSVLRGAADHTNTCVLDCTFVYGSEGTIVDLRDPAAPEIAGKWFGSGSNGEAGLEGVSGSHDVTEVQPGILATASNPVLQLDVNEDPTSPTVIARGNLPDRRYMHGVEWPGGGTDRFLLGGSETSMGCQAELGTFVVWDTLPVRSGEPDPALEGENDRTETPSFTRTGEYALTRGLPTELEGEAPASQHCGHWFTEHPDFQDGGLVAMGWYTSGVRFLEVTPDGAVEEQGFWQPLPGVSSAAFWISEDIVWVTDYTARGIDVLRFNDEMPAQVDEAAPGTFIQAGSEVEKRGAALVNAAHKNSHHSGGAGVADIAEAWVCKPIGGPAPVGEPAALAAGLLGR